MEIDQKPLVLFQEIFLNVIIDISLAQVNAAPKWIGSVEIMRNWYHWLSF